MNKYQIDSAFSIQVSDKVKDATYCTIIKNGNTEIFGGYFSNNTPISDIKKWAEQ